MKGTRNNHWKNIHYPPWNEQFANENRPIPKRKRSYSNHPFFRGKNVSFREGTKLQHWKLYGGDFSPNWGHRKSPPRNVRFIWVHEGSPFISFGPLILRHTRYMGQGNMTLAFPLSVLYLMLPCPKSCWRYRCTHEPSLYKQISISLHVHTFLWDKNSEPKYKRINTPLHLEEPEWILLVAGLHPCYVVSWDLQVLFTDHREWKPSNKLTIHH